jgi:hypothetical protein
LIIVGIDPGLRQCGVAVIDDTGRLGSAWLVKGARTGRGPVVWNAMAEAVANTYAGPLADPRSARGLWLAIERPRIYRAGVSKGDPADLLELQGVVGAIARDWLRAGAQVTAYFPAEWKGQVPKDVHNAQVMARLSVEERERVTQAAPRSLVHNVIDAVGIAAFHHRRTGQRRAA